MQILQRVRVIARKYLVMYNLVDYGNMLRDRVRVDAFYQALLETVSGKRVLEIGGGTGFFACLASALGASQVTSIEMNSLIMKGPALAKANNLTNIQFVHGSSQHFESDQLFDILLHDLRGNTPFFEGSMSTVRNARRLLKPGGLFLPRRDRVFAALIEDGETFENIEGVWGERLAGLELNSLRSETHRRIRYERSKDARHWAPQLVADIDYTDPSTDTVESTSHFEAGHSGVSHGVAIWFDTELTDNVGYTTNPWAPNNKRGTTYGVAFLPWDNPVQVTEGQNYQLQVGLDAKGQASCRLSQILGRTSLLLGSFLESKANADVVQLPVSYHFNPHPLVKAYRIALQGLERGEKVPTVVQKIQNRCSAVVDRNAAYRILTKCVKLTQVQAKRGRERVTWLKFGDLRLRLITNSSQLHKAALESLRPAWHTTRSKREKDLEITLQESYTAEGSAFSITLGEKTIPFYTLKEAMQQLRSLVLHRCILACGQYVGLTMAYETSQNGARIMLDTEGLTLLDRHQKLVPYLISGKEPPEKDALPIVGVEGTEKMTDGLLVSLLIQKCLNPKVLQDPLAYFARLARSARFDEDNF